MLIVSDASDLRLGLLLSTGVLTPQVIGTLMKARTHVRQRPRKAKSDRRLNTSRQGLGGLGSSSIQC